MIENGSRSEGIPGVFQATRVVLCAKAVLLGVMGSIPFGYTYIKDEESPQIFQYELFEKDGFTYYSLKTDNEDTLMRYNADGVCEVINENTWVKSLGYNKKFNLDDDFAALQNLENEKELSDGIVRYNGKEYSSKKLQISEDYIIDFVSENDEDKVIITIHRQGQTAVNIFGNFVCADLPDEKSRFYDVIGLKKNENVFSYYMLSDSMMPTLESEKIYCVEKTENAPEKGDIVLAYAPEYEVYILHRVINITPQGYILKGDKNESPDDIIFAKENIIGILK